MRKGINVNRDKLIASVSIHRVILSVHIPSNNGYYGHSFKVFQNCFESIIKTINKKTKISVFADACSKEVLNYLLDKREMCKNFDVLSISDKNVGKINGLKSLISMSNEEFITITDADVYFISGWEMKISEVFKRYNNAGFVSPSVILGGQNNFTKSTWGFLFNKGIELVEINKNDIIHFARSIGREANNQIDSLFRYGLKKSNVNVVIGAGHFVFTTRRYFLNRIPNKPSLHLLGGGSENEYFDQVIDFLGGLRLSLPKSFAYHMGNQTDDKNLKIDYKLNENLFDSVPKYVEKRLISITRYYFGKLIIVLRSFSTY